MWTAVTWALGLGPLGLMAHGLPSHASKWLSGTHIHERGQRQQADGTRWRQPGVRQIDQIAKER